MKKLVITILCAVIPAVSFADMSIIYDSHGKVVSEKAQIDVFDKESLKRGAIAFADYCLSCHAAEYMRYNRVAKDLGIEESEVRDMMIFTRDDKGKPTKIGNLMKISMTDEYALAAFNTTVPDLSLTARSRGANWLYTYLRTFYLDPYRATGMNNVQFSDVSMPHVLWELQGLQKAVYEKKTRVQGEEEIEVEYLDRLEIVQPGTMSEEEFNAFTLDLVNFMVYVAEPVQAERRSLGLWVLGFLVIFFFFAFALKKEYWKDVH